MKRFLIIATFIACIFFAGCLQSQTSTASTLQFSSSPSGAQIYLDNKLEGITPLTISNVPAGQHSVEYQLSGYNNWVSNVTVSSTVNVYSINAALSPLTVTTTQPTPASQEVTIIPTATSAGSQPTITLKESQSIMVLGSTQTFTGTCTGSNSVTLVLTGPGIYSNGVKLAEVPVDSFNAWSYTWNPGSKILSGKYTIAAYDSQMISSATSQFSVVGGGTVSILATPIRISPGGTVALSGLSTTGSTSVSLTLYPPGQGTAVSLGVLPLAADNTWSYSYKFDVSRQQGAYTFFVTDAQNTASSSVVVTVST